MANVTQWIRRYCGGCKRNAVFAVFNATKSKTKANIQCMTCYPLSQEGKDDAAGEKSNA